MCRGRFRLASGEESDFYVDARTTTLDPRGMELIGALGWRRIEEAENRLGFHAEAIGGLTMGADPVAFAVSSHAYRNRRRLIQAVVIRKELKKHGRHKLIEGNFAKGQAVVVVDDVITTGGSTLKAIQAVREAGGEAPFVLALVDREEGGRERIENEGCIMASLFRKRDFIPDPA